MDECLERKTNCQALILRGYTSGYNRTTRFREVRNEFPRKTPIRVSRSRCKLRGASGTREEVKPKGNEFRTDAVKARPFYVQKSRGFRLLSLHAASPRYPSPLHPVKVRSSWAIPAEFRLEKLQLSYSSSKLPSHAALLLPPLLSVQRLLEPGQKRKTLESFHPRVFKDWAYNIRGSSRQNFFLFWRIP